MKISARSRPVDRRLHAGSNLKALLGACVLTIPAASPAATAAAQPTAALGGASLAQLAYGLAMVLLAIAVTAWLARRFLHLRPGMAGNLRVLGGLSVGGRERVVLVQVGETQLLLGVAPGRVQALHVLEQPLTDAARQSPMTGSTADGFVSVLRRAMGERGGSQHEGAGR